MADNNAGVGHRSKLLFSGFINRPRRSPSVNTNIPTAGFATTSSASTVSPQVTSPQVTSPQVTSPRTTAPQATSPQATTPPTSSPQATTPQTTTTPRATTPQATTPQATLPQATASKATAPQHDASSFRSPPTRRPVAETPTVTGAPPPPYGSPEENKLALLEKYDTVFVIDDSGSMQKHWVEVQAILENIAPICTKYDNDGIDIYFLNHERRDETGKLGSSPQLGRAPGGYNNIRDARQIAQIFLTIRPNGITETGARLRSILNPYMRLYEDKLKKFRLVDKYSELDQKDMKPINIIVFTDGKADDDLTDEIILVARRLDDLKAPLNQVGIQFFRVGNVAGAAQYFQKLDDDIGEGVRDIVDTVTWDAIVPGHNLRPSLGLSAEGILKVVLGAVVRHLDRQETRSARARIGSRATRGESI